MKKLYHVCITAHREVLMRNQDDARNLTNLTALAAIRNDVSILADSLMSNHMHFIMLASSPEKFALSLRISFTKHFNYIHSRQGRLFERRVFVSELDGTRHTLMAMNYVLRNGLHHGQSETAFAYPYSTCNHIYRKARGLADVGVVTNRSEIHSFLPINADFPDTFSIDKNGFVNRSSFEEIRIAESWYGTSNSFIYNMNRRTSEDWIKEQNQDENNIEPVTLKTIEKGVRLGTEKELLKNESGARASLFNQTDMDVCELIDNSYLCRYQTDSIYRLDDRIRRQIAVELINENHINAGQAVRCLAIPISILPQEYVQRFRRQYC